MEKMQNQYEGFLKLLYKAREFQCSWFLVCFLLWQNLFSYYGESLQYSNNIILVTLTGFMGSIMPAFLKYTNSMHIKFKFSAVQQFSELQN